MVAPQEEAVPMMVVYQVEVNDKTYYHDKTTDKYYSAETSEEVEKTELGK